MLRIFAQLSGTIFLALHYRVIILEFNKHLQNPPDSKNSAQKSRKLGVYFDKIEHEDSFSPSIIPPRLPGD